MKEANKLLNRLGELDEAPLIWVNKKVYDMAQEIERLKIDYQQANDIIVEQNKEIERLKEEYMILQNASDEVEEELQQRLEDINHYIEQRCKEEISETERAILQSIELISKGIVKAVRE